MAYSAICFALLVLGASASVHAGKSQDSVIQKVVEMLAENKVKVVETLKQEEAEMAEYAKFCDEELESKGYAIKDATRKIDDLNAVIDDASAQIRALEDEIATLGTEMAGKESEVASAADVRKKERASFEGVEKSMVSSIDALEKAIVLVKRGAGFLQVSSKPTSESKKYAVALAKVLGPVIDAAWVDRGSAAVVKNFLQQHDNSGASGQDEFALKAQHKAKTSEGILGTLEDMKQKAQETLSSARMQEMKANHNSQMMIQSITDAINLCKSKLSDATSTKASLTESSGKAKGELAETKKAKVADMFYSDSLKQECAAAAGEWDDRQKSAKGEIAALDKAKEILTAKVKVLVQKDDPYESDDDEPKVDGPDSAKRNSLVQQLQTLGHKFNSYAMMEMAGAAAQDPLEKIRGLVEDMIAKLVEEANAEATQKDFCDEEKAKSGAEKDAKSMKADDLTSRIDVATAGKAKLGENIKELQAELASLDKATAEATKIRAEEAATFAVASKDYKDGAAAVEEAIRVLKEYYASQSSFVQKKSSKGPIFAFGQSMSASDTIISILETSAEDFSRMSTQLETDENEAIESYKKAMEESKVSAVAKKDAVKAAETEIKVLDVALQADTEDLKMTHKELDAVMEYVEKLKPQCEVKIMTYEEKKAKREAEIEGLKEALSILDAPALVQTKKH
jgi:chromosome segregation ATPase